MKRKSAALQMQQFVGEEKNDLLDYLRSLQPEQVLPFVKILCLCFHYKPHLFVYMLYNFHALPQCNSIFLLNDIWPWFFYLYLFSCIT